MNRLYIDPISLTGQAADDTTQPHNVLFSETNQGQVAGVSGWATLLMTPTINGLALVSIAGSEQYGTSQATDTIVVHRVAGFAGDWDTLGAQTTIYKAALLLGVDANVAVGSSANVDLSVNGDAIRFGKANGSLYDESNPSQYVSPDGPVATQLLRWSWANPAAWPHGDHTSTYALMCVDSAGIYRTIWHVGSSWRCVADFKHRGWDQFVIVQDEVFLVPGHSEPIQRAIHYLQNGASDDSPGRAHPDGVTICVDSQARQIPCSDLTTAARIMSREDGRGIPKRQYGVLTQIFSPGAVTLQWDCPGIGDAPQCTPSNTYVGGHGVSDRVTIAGGYHIGGSVSQFEDLIINKITNGPSDTTLIALALNPGPSWTGGEACGALSCVAYLGSRGELQRSFPGVTTSGSRTLPYQYLISQLVAGVYEVAVGGTPVKGSPFNVLDGYNAIEFESVAGLVTIQRAGSRNVNAVLLSITVTTSYSAIADGRAQFNALGSYSDGSTIDVTSQSSWKSSAPGVASIGRGGLASALTGGQTIITASLGGLTSQGFQLAVLVGTSNAKPNGAGEPVAVQPILSQPVAGGSLLSQPVARQAIVSPSSSGAEACGAQSCVAYVSSTNLISTFGFITDLSGTLPYNYVISGVSPGVYSVTIGGRPLFAAPVTVLGGDSTATFEGGAGNVNINPSLAVKAALVAIVVSAKSKSLPVGGHEQVSAMGTYGDGSVADLTGQVTWVSNPPGTVAISTRGVATALVVGQADITAILNGLVSNIFDLAVTAPITCDDRMRLRDPQSYVLLCGG